MEYKRITIKVGTSSLTHENGKFNIRNVELLVRTIADIINKGTEVILVTSGAIGVGVTNLLLEKRPKEVSKKQAVAAVGQLQLMFIYNKLFSEYNIKIGQVLLTKDAITDENRKVNVVNTIDELLKFGVLPIVNENDTVSVDEIVFGDNDTLSANVASITKSDLLIILSDIKGLYDKNPREFDDAKLVDVVECINDSIKAMAGGAGSEMGTGGMITKLHAAEIINKVGVDMVLTSGNNPAVIFDILEGKQVGTIFKGNC